MLKFIRAQSGEGFIGRREWWSIGKQYEAKIAFGQDHELDHNRSIWLTAKDGTDIAPIVAKKLNIPIFDKKQNDPIRLNASIDSYLIECSEDKLMDLLKRIDALCENL